MTTDTPESDCGEPAPYDVGLCVLLAEHVGWHRASDGTEWVTGNQSGIVDVVADMTDYVDQLRVQLARVTQERDQTRVELAALKPIVDAAFAYADSTDDPTDTPHEDALLDAVTAYRALIGATPEVSDAD